MQARMQLSLECELSFGSWVIGRPRRCGTVASRIGRGSFGRECSMMMATVGPERDSDGCWKGRDFTPRVTISRAWASVTMPFAFCVSDTAEIT